MEQKAKRIGKLNIIDLIAIVLIVAVLALILYQGRKSWFEGPDDFDYV